MLQDKASMSSQTREVRIGNISIQVEVADTEAARIRGLSGKESLKEGSGMLFVFEEAGEWGIWMKDMQFPIDIIWADESGTIITIAKNIAPDTYPKSFYPTTPTVKYVLEVPAGFVQKEGIAEGDRIVI